MPDLRTIRVFMMGMECMALLVIATVVGAFWYAHTVRDPAEEAAFEAEMQERKAFLEEHERLMEEHRQRMDAYQREGEARRPTAREDKAPCP
jgi:hypothetical protein